MKAVNSATQAFTELVFENRNKEYGAYVLRTRYSLNVSRALFFTCSFFLGLTLLGAWLSKMSDVIPSLDLPNDPPVKSVLIDIPSPDKQKVEVKLKDPNPPKSTNGAYKPDDHAVKGPDTPPDLPITPDPNPKGPVGPIVDSVPRIPEPPIVKDPPIVSVPDKMPFLEGLYETIKSNLRYPVIAKENGTSGTVYLSFIVNTDGSVSDMQVLKRVEDGCTEEAVRVAKLLKNWTPGYKDGKPVRVPCTLPIKFSLH
jgi:periplasmic protein TonB